jgi:hypothetical protein
MADEQLNYAQNRYNEYSKQRGDLAKVNVELGGRYDQWILTLSGGSLLASITFLEKIAPHPAHNTIFVVGLAWLFLIVSLLTGFLSLLTAQYAAFRQIEILDAEYLEYLTNLKTNPEGSPVAKTSPQINKYSQITHYLNCISAPTFVIGVALLCVFAYLNIPTGETPAAVPQQVDVFVKFEKIPHHKK